MIRKHKFKLFLLLAAAAWGYNLWIYEEEKLEAPIFLEHYYDMPLQYLQHTDFYYIANKDQESKPYRIKLRDGLELNVHFVNMRDTRGRFALYEMRASRIEYEGLQLSETESFKEAAFFFRDGTTVTAPIGEIRLRPDRTTDSPFRSIHGSSSSDGTGASGYEVVRNTVLRSVKHSFPERIRDALHITVTSTGSEDPAVFPLSLEAADGLTMRYQFHPEDERKFSSYRIQLEWEAEDGELIPSGSIYHQPRLYRGDLAEYVRLYRK